MPSPKQQVTEQLRELEVLQKERDSLEAKQEKAVSKYLAEFEKATAPINEKFQEKLAPVNQRIYALQKDIEAALLTNTGADGSPKLKNVSSDALVAEVVQSAARREVDAETFFNAVPALKRHGEAFWNCFAVQIGKAEKLLGAAINDIAKVKQNFRVVIRPK